MQWRLALTRQAAFRCTERPPQQKAGAASSPRHAICAHQAQGRAAHTLTMLLTARSLDVEQTATCTPLLMASSAHTRCEEAP